MPSPFPGMDPYLEQPNLWPDVHQRFITYISDAIQPRLRPKYQARIGERVYVVEPVQSFYPDITVIRTSSRKRSPTGAASSTALIETSDEPVLVTFPPTEVREPFVEVIHHATGDVVTLIEVLSTANKTAGEGRQLYLKKQEQVLRSQAHLVEIDLLSRGLPAVAASAAVESQMPGWRYLVSVNRHPERHQFEVYPFQVDSRLPRCRIPLREPDPDVVLNLPAVFERVYENGGYPDFIDYREAPPVPLSPAESAWLSVLLAEKGLRPKTPGEAKN